MKNILVFITLTCLSACSVKTYYESNQSALSDMKKHDYKRALKDLGKNSYLKKRQNELLSQMEKGRVAHLEGDYRASNQFLSKAIQLMDSWPAIRHRTIYGSNVVIENNKPSETVDGLKSPWELNYRSEDFEKIMVFYYKVLNDVYLNNKEAALDDVKQLESLLQKLDENKFAESGHKYIQQAFPNIIRGFIYESRGAYEQAFNAYEQAAKLYGQVIHKRLSGTAIPLQLKKDLLNAAFKMGAKDKVEFYSRTWDLTYEPVSTPSEMILLFEKGFIPYKEEVNLEKTDNYTRVEDRKIKNTNVTTVYKVPKFASGYSACVSPVVKYNEEWGTAEKVFDLEFYTSVTINTRFDGEAITYLSRSAAKAINAEGKVNLNDYADTRHWQTLPAFIYYSRVPLKAGENTIEVLCNDSVAVQLKEKPEGNLVIRNAWR